MKVNFEGFVYKFENGKWFYLGDDDGQFNGEVLNIATLERLNKRFSK